MPKSTHTLQVSDDFQWNGWFLLDFIHFITSETYLKIELQHNKFRTNKKQNRFFLMQEQKRFEEEENI